MSESISLSASPSLLLIEDSSASWTTISESISSPSAVSAAARAVSSAPTLVLSEDSSALWTTISESISLSASPSLLLIDDSSASWTTISESMSLSALSILVASEALPDAISWESKNLMNLWELLADPSRPEVLQPVPVRPVRSSPVVESFESPIFKNASFWSLTTTTSPTSRASPE